MFHSIRRGLALMVLLAIAIPAATAAQLEGTPAPEPVPTFDLTLIGVAEVGGELESSSADQGRELVHAMQMLDIDPGATVPQLRDARSVVISGQAGGVRVTTEAGALVTVGTGNPVRSADGSVLCESRECRVDAGSVVMLGVGNGLSVSNGTLEFAVVGDEPASVLVSMMIPESGFDGRCWICPTVKP